MNSIVRCSTPILRLKLDCVHCKDKKKGVARLFTNTSHFSRLDAIGWGGHICAKPIVHKAIYSFLAVLRQKQKRVEENNEDQNGDIKLQFFSLQ